MAQQAHTIDSFANTFTPWKILVIDDHQLYREQTHHLIHEAGFVVDHVPTGEEAIELCRLVHYDLILVELGMKGMDGFEICGAIRKSGKQASTTHIVALTEQIYDHTQVQQCLARGLDDCIAKPLKESTLKDRIKRWRTQGRHA